MLFIAIRPSLEVGLVSLRRLVGANLPGRWFDIRHSQRIVIHTCPGCLDGLAGRYKPPMRDDLGCHGSNKKGSHPLGDASWLREAQQGSRMKNARLVSLRAQIYELPERYDGLQ